MNYYNEFDPYAAQWLRNLIDAGQIPAGHVDTRSIVDVQPSDLTGYTQCHFFAGIGGWSLAARLAGWPDNRELWTGSAPCQPFSVAGQGKAQDDDRHLWPHFARLIRARRPAVVMGEQVAAAVGKNWLDGVADDMEGIGYACRAVVVPACAVDAPHRRDRLWFVAHANRIACEQRGSLDGRGDQGSGAQPWPRSGGGSSRSSDVADSGSERCLRWPRVEGGGRTSSERSEEVYHAGHSGSPLDVADANSNGREPGDDSAPAAGHRRAAQPSSGIAGWGRSGWITGHDGKARRIPQSGVRLLAHGLFGRMAIVRPGFEGRAEKPEAVHWYSRQGALKAFGNAIVPQVAAEVIGAYMDCYPND